MGKFPSSDLIVPSLMSELFVLRAYLTSFVEIQEDDTRRNTSGEFSGAAARE